MKKESILEEEALEAINVIKEIDTLSIVNEAYNQNEKRKLHLKSIGVLFVAIMVLIINFALVIKIGIKPFLTLQLFLSWLITMLFLPMLKKTLKEVKV